MKIDSEVKDEVEPEKNEEERKQVLPKFKDSLTAYMYYSLEYMPETVFQEYMAITKRIYLASGIIGRKLLYDKNGKMDESIKETIEEALSVLEKAVPIKRTTKFQSQDIAGNKYPVYYITADDAGETQAETERLRDISENFKEQQYENCKRKMIKIDLELFVLLQRNEIVPVELMDVEKYMNYALSGIGLNELFKEDILDEGKENEGEEEEIVEDNSKEIIPPGTADETVFAEEEKQEHKEESNDNPN